MKPSPAAAAPGAGSSVARGIQRPDNEAMDPRIVTPVAGLLADVIAAGAQGGIFWDSRRVRPRWCACRTVRPWAVRHVAFAQEDEATTTSLASLRTVPCAGRRCLRGREHGTNRTYQRDAQRHGRPDGRRHLHGNDLRVAERAAYRDIPDHDDGGAPTPLPRRDPRGTRRDRAFRAAFTRRTKMGMPVDEGDKTTVRGGQGGRQAQARDER